MTARERGSCGISLIMGRMIPERIARPMKELRELRSAINLPSR